MLFLTYLFLYSVETVMLSCQEWSESNIDYLINHLAILLEGAFQPVVEVSQQCIRI